MELRNIASEASYVKFRLSLSSPDLFQFMIMTCYSVYQ